MTDNKDSNKSSSINPQTIASIKKYVEMRAESGYSLEANIRAKNEFENPEILSNCVDLFEINEYGNNFSDDKPIIDSNNVDSNNSNNNKKARLE